MVMDFEFPEFELPEIWEKDLPEEIPCLFEIAGVKSDSPKYESEVVLRSICDESYENDLLSCKIYINGEPSGCIIETLNGYKFPTTVHLRVKTISRQGVKNKYWNPREQIKLNLRDSLIKNGDTIKVDIIWKPDDKVISTDEYYFP